MKKNRNQHQTTSRSMSLFFFIVLLCAFPQTIWAHFGMVIPDTPRVTQEKPSATLDLFFAHPFEGAGMELVKPEKFSLFVNGEETELTGQLAQSTMLDHTSWKTDYKFKRPGMYSFVMTPAPYWEPAEDSFIIHYTKTIIPAYGEDTGWDTHLGLPTEIVPLTRPFGNYAGNSFTGQVLVNGKPAPMTEIEVEYYNREKTKTSPSDYHVTQVVKSDGSGIFTFTCPYPGWWGFAALTEADYTLKDPEGHDKGVELGAVLWTYFD